MQIELPDGASPGAQVAFDSELGRAIARWEGPQCQPGTSVHVELDVDPAHLGGTGHRP